MPKFNNAIFAFLIAAAGSLAAQNAYQPGAGSSASTQAGVPSGYVSAADAYPQSNNNGKPLNEAQLAAQAYRGPSTGPVDGGEAYAGSSNGNQGYPQTQPQQSYSYPAQGQPSYNYAAPQTAYPAQTAPPVVDSAIQYPAYSAPPVAVVPYPYPYRYYGYPYYRYPRPYVGLSFGFGYGRPYGYAPYRGYAGGFRGGFRGRR